MNVVTIYVGIILVPIMLAILVGLGFLQVYLSRREGKIAGLVIPGVFFLLSLIWLLSIPAEGLNFGVALQMVCVLLLLTNIPTFIYLAIYFVCRDKWRKKSQMDRMNIQDLD